MLSAAKHLRTGACEARHFAALLLVVLGPQTSAVAQSTRPAPTDDSPRVVCTLRDPRLREVSGVAASRLNRDMYYVHNDSGGGPVVYLIDRDGNTRLELKLRGAAAVDYEDIALAPGASPGAFDVCVADIGDNKAHRGECVVYRFAEVDLAKAAQALARIDAEPTPAPLVIDVDPLAYRFTYADGPQDAEGLAIDPRRGDGYVFTKRTDGVSRVYRIPAPWDASRRATLSQVASLRFPDALPLATTVTAADFSPDGGALVTRSYVGGWLWRLPAGPLEPEALHDALAGKPLPIELPAMRQGEAIGFTRDGRSLITLSEGAGAEVYEVRVPP